MKKSKFKLFDSVVADRDIFEPDLAGAWGRGKPAMIDGRPSVARGTAGIVVDLLSKDGVAVEFFDAAGDTIDVAFIAAESVRPATPKEKEESRALTQRLNAGL
jgi:hypothetical protein